MVRVLSKKQMLAFPCQPTYKICDRSQGMNVEQKADVGLAKET
jgi:hypothetical protein